MPLTFNLRHLERASLQLDGELPPADLDLEGVDELIQLPHPVKYELLVELINDAVLVTGNIELTLACECVRCLKPFDYRLALSRWACHLPLEGEERVAIQSDCVDLTPFLREDILLAFPQYPLCDTECRGLPQAPPNTPPKPGGALQTQTEVSVWEELNRLKL